MAPRLLKLTGHGRVRAFSIFNRKPIDMSLSLNTTNLTPIGDRVLVKLAAAEEEKVGGIYIPDSAKEKPAEGEIVAVGPGKLNDAGERVAIDLAVGDRVLFSKYGGTEVKLDGEDFLIMREDDILGVIQA